MGAAMVGAAARQYTTSREVFARDVEHISIPSYRKVTERDADKHTWRHQT
jgi:hypothetical protein